MEKSHIKKSYIILIVIIAVLVLGAFWAMSMYNSLVSLDEQAKEAWGNVETQYQRRVDLIPNLVETVKGFAKQELTVFTEVTKLRSQWGAAKAAGDIDKQIESARGLEGAIGRLLFVSENYPELKSDENFLRLQDELAGTENRVAVARTRYNEVVKEYNTKARRFPSSIIAGWFGFSTRTSFEAAEGAEKAPTVEFG